MRSNLTVKISVYWITACSVEGTHILKIKFIIYIYRDTKYPIEINLMGISDSRLGHFSKKLLKFIFNEIRFHKYE